MPLKKDLTDPIINAKTLDDAAEVAQKQIDDLSIELQNVSADHKEKFRKLLAVGTPVEVISKLSGFSINAVKRSIGLV